MILNYLNQHLQDETYEHINLERFFYQFRELHYQLYLFMNNIRQILKFYLKIRLLLKFFKNFLQINKILQLKHALIHLQVFQNSLNLINLIMFFQLNLNYFQKNLQSIMNVQYQLTMQKKSQDKKYEFFHLKIIIISLLPNLLNYFQSLRV